MPETYGKAVISGSLVETYQYEKPVFYGMGGFTRPPVERKPKDPNAPVNPASVARARKQLRRLIYANTGFYRDASDKIMRVKFLTLTFADNISDIKKAHYEFRKFMLRLNTLCYKTKNNLLRYVAVPEFQQRGAVHYHVLLFNLPYIKRVYDELNEVWGQGYFWLKVVDDLEYMALYLIKYLRKGMEDPRLRHRKKYFASKNLLKPMVIREDVLVREVLKTLPSALLATHWEFNSEHVGLIRYNGFKLKNNLSSLILGDFMSSDILAKPLGSFTAAPNDSLIYDAAEVHIRLLQILSDAKIGKDFSLARVIARVTMRKIIQFYKIPHLLP